MSRKRFDITPEMRRQVKQLAALGMPEEAIAAKIGCTLSALLSRFRHELEQGPLEANAIVRGSLFAQAMAGNISAIIFFLKTRGWVAATRKRRRDRASAEDRPAFIQILVPVGRTMEDGYQLIPYWPEAVERCRKKRARRDRQAERERVKRPGAKD